MNKIKIAIFLLAVLGLTETASAQSRPGDRCENYRTLLEVEESFNEIKKAIPREYQRILRRDFQTVEYGLADVLWNMRRGNCDRPDPGREAYVTIYSASRCQSRNPRYPYEIDVTFTEDRAAVIKKCDPRWSSDAHNFRLNTGGRVLSYSIDGICYDRQINGLVNACAFIHGQIYR